VAPTRNIERIARPDAPIFAPSARARRSRPARWARRFAITMVVLLAVVLAAPRITTWVLARGDVAHHVSDLPKLGAGDRRAAIVLGAGLKNKRPSPLLADRIDAAVDAVLDGGHRTRDLGGDVGTRAAGDLILEALRA
jgi:vancomycin permeability regulator SanA